MHSQNKQLDYPPKFFQSNFNCRTKSFHSSSDLHLKTHLMRNCNVRLYDYHLGAVAAVHDDDRTASDVCCCQMMYLSDCILKSHNSYTSVHMAATSELLDVSNSCTSVHMAVTVFISPSHHYTHVRCPYKFTRRTYYT